MTSYTEQTAGQEFAWYKTSWDADAGDHGQLTVYGKIKEGTPLSSGDTLRFRVFLQADMHTVNPDTGDVTFNAASALQMQEIVIGTGWSFNGIIPPSDSLRFEFTLASNAAVSPGETLLVYHQGVPNDEDPPILEVDYFSLPVTAEENDPATDLPSNMNDDTSWSDWYNNVYQGGASGDPYIKAALV